MKKTISLCIVLILLLSVPFPCTLAENAEDTAQTKSFELVEALKIDEGINSDEQALVTRAEFVAMAVRCINYNGLDVYDGGFSDVTENDAFSREIYAAKLLRMTNGTAPGVFSPDAAVTMPVALKMVMTAMGYEGIAQAKGGYPSGYMALESTLRLLKGTKIEGELTVYDAKTIITNALTAEAAVFDGIADNDIIYDRSKGKNLLTEKFNLRKIEGIVTTAGYLTVETEIPEENTLKIAGRSFKCRVSSPQYFGMQVTAWYSEDNDEVYAVEKGKLNKEITISAKDVTGYSDGVLTVFVDSRTVRYKMDKSLSFMENGRLISHNNTDFIFDDGSIRLIDNDNDGFYEFAMAEKIDYYVVSAVNAATKTIYDKNSSVGGICFDHEADENKGKHRILLDNNGQEYQFSDISAGDVVNVMISDDEKVCIVRAGGSRVVNGVLSAITEDGIEISGEEYKTNGYYTKRTPSLILGTEYSFVIASDNTVTLVTEIGANGIVYGYLIDYGKSFGGISQAVQVKLLTAADTKEIYSLAKKITLNGEKNVERTDAKIDAALQNGIYPRYQVVRYKLNDNGEISMLDTTDGSVDNVWDIPEENPGQDTLKQYLSKTEVNFREGGTFGAPYFSFAKGLIFAIPKALQTTHEAEYDEKLFRVMERSELVNNVNYVADIYDLDEYYYPSVISVYTEETGSTNIAISDEADVHVVYDVKNAVDAEGNDTIMVRTYAKGIYHRYYVDSDALDTVVVPGEGDLVRIKFNSAGKIIGIALDAKYNASTGELEVKYTEGHRTSRLAYIVGSVKTIGNGAVTLKATEAPETVINNVAALSLGSTSYVIYHTETGEVEKGVMTDVIGENVAGIENASKVVCRLKYYQVRDIFIYTK